MQYFIQFDDRSQNDEVLNELRPHLIKRDLIIKQVLFSLATISSESRYLKPRAQT